MKTPWTNLTSNLYRRLTGFDFMKTSGYFEFSLGTRQCVGDKVMMKTRKADIIEKENMQLAFYSFKNTSQTKFRN